MLPTLGHAQFVANGRWLARVSGLVELNKTFKAQVRALFVGIFPSQNSGPKIVDLHLQELDLIGQPLVVIETLGDFRIPTPPTEGAQEGRHVHRAFLSREISGKDAVGVAQGRGLEPRFTASKAAVLPLDDP